MARLNYLPPPKLNGPAYFGGSIVSLDRLKTLLMLCGHGTIENGGKRVSLGRDYLAIPTGTSGVFKVSELPSKIPGCTLPQFRSLLSNAAIKNTEIHANVFREVMHCLYHYETGSYIASFVHLYRLVEHAALYLPLVSIVSKGVNNLTFAQYKEVVDNKAKADLSVLKNFSQKVLADHFAKSKVVYSFSSNSNPTGDCRVLRTLVDDKLIVDSGPDFVELEYKVTDRLIVNFRNQFFHYLYHEKNISLRQLESPDEFLEVCLPHFIKYFAFLFQDLLVAEWELWAT